MSQAQVRNDLSALGRVAQDPVTGKLTTAQLQALGHVVVRNGTATPTSVSRAIGMTRVQLPAVYQWLDGTTPIPAHWAEKIEALIS